MKTLATLRMIALLAGCATLQPTQVTLEYKARQIIIPEIDFRSANLHDVIEFLHQSSIKHGTDGNGVNIIPIIPEYLDLSTISMTARNMSLYDVLAYVAECNELTVRVDDNALVLCEPRPEADNWRYEGEFHAVIADADRIIVRDGGFGCCGPVRDDPIIFVVTDAQEIKDLHANLVFEKKQGSSFCLCCGRPGIDWYRGDEGLARTSVKHGSSIMWQGFDETAELTPDCAAWLNKWLLGHGVTKEQMR